MREKIRGEEHDMAANLIKLHDFTHASRVTKFSASFVLRQRDLTKLWLLLACLCDKLNKALALLLVLPYKVSKLVVLLNLVEASCQDSQKEIWQSCDFS